VKVKATIRGGRNLARVLRTLPDDLQQPVKDVIRQQAEAVLQAAKSAVPVKTGALRDDIRIRFTNKGLRARVGVFRRTKRQLAKGVSTFYAAFVEFGTQRSKPKPFLFPAFRARKTSGRAAIAKAAKNALQKQAAKRDRT
jgi:HK97 gp10 family phage protein